MASSIKNETWILSSEMFSDNQHKSFRKKLQNLISEPEVMTDIFPQLIGEANYSHAINRLCTNWDPLVDDSLVTPQPDYFDGAKRKPEYRGICEELSSSIAPSKVFEAPILPNFFIEAKSHAGSMAVATRQACYDGAFGTRGFHALQKYAPEHVLENNAYTVSAVYIGGLLKIYTHHWNQPDGPGTQPHYYMAFLASWSLDGSPGSFCEGVGALRNARDLAYEYRELILKAASARLNALFKSNKHPGVPRNLGPEKVKITKRATNPKNENPKRKRQANGQDKKPTKRIMKKKGNKPDVS